VSVCVSTWSGPAGVLCFGIFLLGVGAPSRHDDSSTIKKYSGRFLPGVRGHEQS
jgi:hypothetical protein